MRSIPGAGSGFDPFNTGESRLGLDPFAPVMTESPEALSLDRGFLCGSFVFKDLAADGAGVVFVVAAFCAGGREGLSLGQ